MAVAAIAPLVLLAAAACGGDDNGDEQHGASYEGVISAVTFTSSAGLHDIDEAINDDRTVPATARTAALRAQAVLKLTQWPADLRAEAEALAATLGELAEALDAEPVDMAAAGRLAKKAHDDEHEFSAKVWRYLYEAAGIEAGAGHGH
jgi:hypothetical protein